MMKAQINPEIEFLLLPLCYLEHLSNSRPEFKRAIELLPPFNRYESLWKDLNNMKENLELAITIPQYNFSNILSKDEYYKMAANAIKDIQLRYLDDQRNRLTNEDKQYILTGLEQFYSQTEFSVIPFYNQFKATKDDRTAYMYLSMLYMITMLANVFSLMKIKYEESQLEMERNKADITKMYEQLKSEMEIVDGKKVFKSPGIKEEDFENLEAFYKQLNIDDNPTFEQLVLKTAPNISMEQVNLFMHYFKLKPEENAEIMDSELFNGFDGLEMFGEDFELDNKALQSNYIRLIYSQVEKNLAKMSEHVKCNLAGYIALNFGILKEEDYKPATSSYPTITTFVRERVKGVLKTPKGKLKAEN